MLVNKKNNALLAEQAGGEFNCRLELTHKMGMNRNTQAPNNRLDLHCILQYPFYHSRYTKPRVLHNKVCVWTVHNTVYGLLAIIYSD